MAKLSLHRQILESLSFKVDLSNAFDGLKIHC